jgi:hypothetical protein
LSLIAAAAAINEVEGKRESAKKDTQICST